MTTIKAGSRGARIHGVRPEMVLAAMIVAEIFRERGAALVITSGIDGKHSAGSLHYVGAALDFGAHGVPAAIRHKVRDEIKAGLGDDYDVLLEYEGTPNEHYHVEYQPKKPY